MTAETKHTPGPWFVSGVRFKMNGGEWHSVNRYDEDHKRDENIACVGYDPRTGAGMADAHLIAAAPEMAEALRAILGAQTDLLHVGYDDAPGGGNYVYADVIRTDNPAFDLARAVLQKAGG